MRPTTHASLSVILLIAVAGGVSCWLRPPTIDDIADDYRSRVRPNLRLDYVTSEPAALERYLFGIEPLAFRVPDLTRESYVLVGGGLHQHRGRAVAFAVYRGAHGERVMSETYYAAPPTAVPVHRQSIKGIEFTTYRQDELSIVFWRDGDFTSVFASTGEVKSVVELAVASLERR